MFNMIVGVFFSCYGLENRDCIFIIFLFRLKMLYIRYICVFNKYICELIPP